jgi:hypothetical protein
VVQAKGENVFVQRQSLEEEEEVQMKPAGDASFIQRQPSDEEEEDIQMKGESGRVVNNNTRGLQHHIHSLKGGGQPLSQTERSYFEPRFGRSFEGIRIHTSATGADAARRLQAKAFTTGHDIVFGTGQYAPDTGQGKRLLTHELTHVVQQSDGDESTVQQNCKEQIYSTNNLIQRQQDSTEISQLTDKDWFMLKPPPVYKQDSYTCWAASLASWLNVRNMSTISDKGLLEIYESPPSTCLDSRGVLLYAHDDDVFGEWWMVLTKVERAEWEKVKSMLRTYGHLLVATGTNSSVAHDMVIYGYGFDENGEPCSGCVSLMDPLEGEYRNDTLYNLGFPLYLGVPKSKRGTEAGCRSRPLP